MAEQHMENTVLKEVKKSNTKTKAAIALAVLALIGGGVWLSQPSPAGLIAQNQQDSVERLDAMGDENQKILSIVPEESMAKYEIDEVLNGKPTHVVGVTHGIAGDVSVRMESPSKIHIGEIRLDAKSFKTDIAKRDENVIAFVLESDKPGNEFISFKTTDIAGLPEIIETNKDYPVTVKGDITIKGVTKPISFEGTVNVGDGKMLQVTANAMLNREDFGVKIPNFPFLANVSEMVKLAVDFIAK